jgi:hypothetical protein
LIGLGMISLAVVKRRHSLRAKQTV